MVPFTARPEGSRRQGVTYVRSKPAAGFFIGGSSVSGLNGVYARSQHVPRWLARECELAYENVLSGWWLLLVRPRGYRAVGGETTEWVLVDGSNRDRFAHAGATVIPGSGPRWQHVRRGSSSSSSLATGAEDREDELPAQVVFLGDSNRVAELAREARAHERKVESTMLRLPEAPAGFEEEADGLAGNSTRQLETGDYDACAATLAAVTSRLEVWWRSSASQGARRVLLTRRGRCERRARRLVDARATLDKAIAHPPALVERGLLFLDLDEASRALGDFEAALALDRSLPGLDDLLVAARAAQRREKKNGRPNPYALLDLPVDFDDPELLKRHFRAKSMSAHPDRGGSSELFHALSRAHDLLVDPAARRAYDRGDAEDVLRHYFPERFPFEPFGDAHPRLETRRHSSYLSTSSRPGAAAEGLASSSCRGDTET
ncbi:hypothetical protein CTAYLR_008398 [Chrysophaeum taylorii]|uniref:J domain-containing protein n=1 Tax=Chrysophaeum taylorii TaxID=2483200 RepID=A0AAD7UHF9_9STRA|nr:hypothetical protein CTAYLR_008398 [Chrysophaeum taylorii]